MNSFFFNYFIYFNQLKRICGSQFLRQFFSHPRQREFLLLFVFPKKCGEIQEIIHKKNKIIYLNLENHLPIILTFVIDR